MQITRAEVTPVELALHHPVRAAHHPQIDRVTAVFVRIETRQGESAWGCAVAHPDLTGEQPDDVVRACQDCADLVPDLHPTNLEYSLAELEPLTQDTPSALCAFDLAFHDLLGLAAGMPLYRMLGGYRSRIQTSVTIGIAPMKETVEMALKRASEGFRLRSRAGSTPRRTSAGCRRFTGPCPTLCCDWTPTGDIPSSRHWTWPAPWRTAWRCWSSPRLPMT